MCNSHSVYSSQCLHPLTTVHFFFFLNKVPLGTVEGDGRAFLILSYNFFHKKLWLQKISDYFSNSDPYTHNIYWDPNGCSGKTTDSK